MSTLDSREHVATLWRLTWDGSALRCEVYRAGSGFQLAIESAAATILTEAFDLKPRALARAQALRESLKRRGWVEQPPGDRGQPPSA